MEITTAFGDGGCSTGRRIRRVLAEAVVNTIFEEVGNVITDEAPQVLFVQRDHVVQHLAPAAAQPPFARVNTATNSPKIPGYAPFRDDEAELLKLSVDLGGSPIRVLLRQASDQNTNLLGDLRSAAARPGSPTPVETETGSVPADHSLGLHDDEDADPAGSEAAEGRPEESVQGVQCWPRPFAFECGDLLPKGEDFEGGVAPTAKEDSDGGNE